jgi:AraC-like DNA-binding protein
VAAVKEKMRLPEAPIQRILGNNAQVLSRTAIPFNNNIRLERITISYPDHLWPEEHALLNLFPLEDDQFCIQLIYLQYPDRQSDKAVVNWLEFNPGFFEQFPLQHITSSQPFSINQSSEFEFSICKQSNVLLNQISGDMALESFPASMQLTEIAMHLLRRAVECISLPFTVCPVPACRFLAHDTEREKVMEAKRLIDENIDQSHTIKELSRKVAMNECYLKKGFKALIGKTIHEYQHDLRIAKAKDMLKNNGLSVSDVANSLGYSSISHFSTAFKKATGMKPCELLA